MNICRKELLNKSGVYKIVTSINERVYIGSSVNLYIR